jgi:hypothetical protein
MRSSRSVLLTGAALALAGLVGCGGSSSSASDRVYSGTASVGDFLTITVQPAAQTIAYTNHTNGQTGTLGYTVGADGVYTVTSPDGSLIQAIEIPGLALVAEADNTGPSHHTTSLVTAILQAPISPAWLEGQNFNYMQWRTSIGGMSVGNVTVDGSGLVSHAGYWPFGAMQASLQSLGYPSDSTWDPVTTFQATDCVPDASGTSMTMPDQSGGTDTIFGTQGGFFVVDMANGSLIAVPQAASTAFDPSTAGTYQALAFSKTGVTIAPGSNDEVGVAGIASYTMNLTSGGDLTINSNGNPGTAHPLVPVNDTAYLQGGTLLNTSPGLFTYTVPLPGSTQRDVYVEFINGAMLFSSFTYSTSTLQDPVTYSYYYGVALKQ